MIQSIAYPRDFKLLCFFPIESTQIACSVNSDDIKASIGDLRNIMFTKYMFTPKIQFVLTVLMECYFLDQRKSKVRVLLKTVETY